MSMASQVTPISNNAVHKFESNVLMPQGSDLIIYAELKIHIKSPSQIYSW